MGRRQNRQSSSFLVLKIILACGVIIGLSAAFIINFCQTKDVKVRGNHLADANQVREAVLTDPRDVNAVYATVRNYFTRHVSIPFVKSYKVSMKNLNTVVITVKEKELCGYMMNEKGDRYVYYEKDGTVAESVERLIKGTFFVEGITVKEAKAGEPLEVDDSDIQTVLLLQQEFEREGLKVKKVNFSEEGIITFKVKKIKVNLGARSSVSEKVRRLKFILPKLKGMKGTLHLEEWSEENTDIIFEREG
ncbi:MAG: FtsQ-type POTRA domain-containing protein [Lachnospiraceae bacterium]|nr:FtsQ-type POTRA domain-containing protein [Lachnospiraceae bacterium]